ncbi:hypothetical protein LAZ67_10000112 [Cordylochernes scorpioides]|uniref:Uncharacterized protein n=1 Tax=Cordylochernes scorpioides TaxID=51811 RepID=A0ABY6KXK6_9ARAC|nr:hypothetical protein LAZ67_10000112 [Cordylochernes scorpioides]
MCQDIELSKPTARMNDLNVNVPDYTDTPMHSFTDHPQHWRWKPEVLSPAQCAKRGWICVGKDMLECTACHANLCCHLPTSSLAYKECLEELTTQLVTKHQDFCPWSITQKPSRLVYLPKTSRTEALHYLQENFSSLQELERPLPPIRLSSEVELDMTKLQQLLSQLGAPQTQASLDRLQLALLGWSKMDADTITCHRCQRTLYLGIFSLMESRGVQTSEPVVAVSPAAAEPSTSSCVPATLETIKVEPPDVETPPLSEEENFVEVVTRETGRDDPDRQGETPPLEPCIFPCNCKMAQYLAGQIKEEQNAAAAAPQVEPDESPPPTASTSDGNVKPEPVPESSSQQRSLLVKAEKVESQPQHPDPPFFEVEYSPAHTSDEEDEEEEEDDNPACLSTHIKTQEEDSTTAPSQPNPAPQQLWTESLQDDHQVAPGPSTAVASTSQEVEPPPTPRVTIKRSSSPVSEGEIQLTFKRARLDEKTTLDPLYEHRSWCSWVIANPELNSLGWKIFLENVFPPSSDCQRKGKKLGEHLDVPENFAYSSGWLQRFKGRFHISQRRLCVEGASISPAIIDEHLTNLNSILANSGYDPANICNADETGLFFQIIPDRTLAHKDENCRGVKRMKQRITVLLCCKSTGTDKRRLLIIGKSTKPQCFRNFSPHFYCTYTSNSKAWMTSSIFQEWLLQFNKQLVSEGRRILLLLDNATSHCVPNDGLSNIKIHFLQPNMTASLQPLDSGIIKSFKAQYRKLQLQKMVELADAHLPTELRLDYAVRYCKMAWNSVSPDSISNCWNHAGIIRFTSTAAVEPLNYGNLLDHDIFAITPENLMTEREFQLVDDSQEAEMKLTDDKFLVSTVTAK